MSFFPTQKPKRLAFVSTAIACGLLVAAGIAYGFVVNRLPSYIIDHQQRFSLFVVMLVAAYAGFLTVTLHKPTSALIRGFFTATASPFNLAVFRIVLFTTLFVYVVRELRVERIIFLSQLPQELRYPTPGLGFIINSIPINATLAAVTTTIMLICCVMAALGVYTRTSAWITVILAVYALGIPQFYGKVNHYHHLIWFAAILAMSRCSDVLSVDAIFSAWKRADKGDTAIPAPSIIYALPLRLVWLTIGVIYFFPGVWKYWSAGAAWVFSDNLKFRMYQKWYELGGWTPLIRLDEYSPLLQLLALGTIALEIGFIFLLFVPRLRVLAAIGGFMFHTGIYFMMRISFWTLQMCYVSFVNWSGVFGRVGRWLYRKPMFLIYDGNCTLCRRTIASIRVFDVFNQVTYVNGLDRAALITHGLGHLDEDSLLRDIHAVVGAQAWQGVAAYRVLARRIPVLWPLLPLLYLPLVPQIADRIYRRVADSRTCSIVKPTLATASASLSSTRASLRPVVTFATVLLSINCLLGAGGVAYAWPFACYPTFEGVVGPTITTIEAVAHDKDGNLVTFNQRTLKRQFSGERWNGLIRWTIRTKGESNHQQRLQALANLMRENDPQLRGVTSLDFYEATYSTIPADRGQQPIAKQLLMSMSF